MYSERDMERAFGRGFWIGGATAVLLLFGGPWALKLAVVAWQIMRSYWP